MIQLSVFLEIYSCRFFLKNKKIVQEDDPVIFFVGAKNNEWKDEGVAVEAKYLTRKSFEAFFLFENCETLKPWSATLNRKCQWHTF